MDIYKEIILDHYKNPRNYTQKIQEDAKTTWVENPSCGDSIAMRLETEDGTVRDIKFSGSGCALSIAGASLLTEYAKGRSIKEMTRFTKNDMLELLGVSLGPTRMKCALLPLETLHKIINS